MISINDIFYLSEATLKGQPNQECPWIWYPLEYNFSFVKVLLPGKVVLSWTVASFPYS